jgi:Fe-S-cluster-containing dehydrogenase component
MNCSRRQFVTALAAAGASIGPVSATAAEHATGVPRNEEFGMLYDATRCVGCKACMAACKRVNTGSGALGYETASFDSDGLWDAPEDLSGKTRTVVKLAQAEGGRWSYVKQSCMHCQKPSCVSVCPVRAMTKDPVTGAVEYRKSTCIGCRYCQVACPFNIPRFQWDRTMPQIVKCDLCQSTNLKSRGITACAETCPTGALLFGKRGALLADAAARLREHPRRYYPHIYGEHEAGGTNVLYLSALPFDVLGMPALGSHAPAELSERIQHTIYKGCIAPVALFASLCVVALRNQKNGDGHARGEGPESNPQ